MFWCVAWKFWKVPTEFQEWKLQKPESFSECCFYTWEHETDLVSAEREKNENVFLSPLTAWCSGKSFKLLGRFFLWLWHKHQQKEIKFQSVSCLSHQRLRPKVKDLTEINVVALNLYVPDYVKRSLTKSGVHPFIITFSKLCQTKQII